MSSELKRMGSHLHLSLIGDPGGKVEKDWGRCQFIQLDTLQIGYIEEIGDILYCSCQWEKRKSENPCNYSMIENMLMVASI